MMVIYDMIGLIFDHDEATALVGHNRVHLLLLLLFSPVMSIVLRT